MRGSSLEHGSPALCKLKETLKIRIILVRQIYDGKCKNAAMREKGEGAGGKSRQGRMEVPRDQGKAAPEAQSRWGTIRGTRRVTSPEFKPGRERSRGGEGGWAERWGLSAPGGPEHHPEAGLE